MNYYLTEMNLLQLENELLHFTLHHHIEQKLLNGIITKVTSMMYNQHIDYYYPDAVATILEVPIKHIDNVYLHAHYKYYNQSLHSLLQTVNAPTTIIETAPELEKRVQHILQTKKPIKTKKFNNKKKFPKYC